LNITELKYIKDKPVEEVLALLRLLNHHHYRKTEAGAASVTHAISRSTIADYTSFWKYDGVYCRKRFSLETLQGLVCIYFRLDPPQGKTGFAMRRKGEYRPVWGNTTPVPCSSAGEGVGAYSNTNQSVPNSHSKLLQPPFHVGQMLLRRDNEGNFTSCQVVKVHILRFTIMENNLIESFPY